MLKRIIMTLFLISILMPLAAQEVWTGPMIEFEKADGADPAAAANQDRITDSVWITRGNSGGQIYNAVSESRANSRISPDNTLWALGTTADIDSLSFRNFRQAVGSPKSVVGKDLVMYIESDDIYIDVVFTSWSTGKDGGFSYMRSSPAE
jgi:hypothetical protein